MTLKEQAEFRKMREDLDKAIALVAKLEQQVKELKARK